MARLIPKYHIAKSTEQQSNRLRKSRDLTSKDSDLKLRTESGEHETIRQRNGYHRMSDKRYMPTYGGVALRQNQKFGHLDTGRNDKCPCNSGLKFKKCCINKPK